MNYASAKAQKRLLFNKKCPSLGEMSFIMAQLGLSKSFTPFAAVISTLMLKEPKVGNPSESP